MSWRDRLVGKNELENLVHVISSRVFLENEFPTENFTLNVISPHSYNFNPHPGVSPLFHPHPKISLFLLILSILI